MRLKNFTIDANTIAAGATDLGLRRSLNEDAFLIDSKIGLIALADGVGGRDLGEVASFEAINALQEYLAECQAKGTIRSKDSNLTSHQPVTASSLNSTSHILDQTMAAVVHANDKIYTMSQDRGLPPDRSMGTTLIGLICAPDEPWSTVAFHVGDSRIYRLRDRQIEQLTRDDTPHQDWLDNGRVGKEPQRNILSQCIGPQSHVQPTIFAPAFRPDDLLLLCSDGLSDLVDEAELRDIISETDRNQLEFTCQALIAAANNRGGKDNITAVLVSRQ